MILVNSGAFLSISSWFWELTELIFVVTPQNAKDYGYVQVANKSKARGIWALHALSDSLGNPFYLYTRGIIPSLSPAILNTIKWYVRREECLLFYLSF